VTLTFQQHAPHAGFAVADDCLQIGGRPLTELAVQVGRTPFYAYDRALLTQRVELLRRTLPAVAHLHYAIKANPMSEVVRHLGALTDGLDVASAGELRIALASGVKPRTISFAGPGKGTDELREAALAGVTVNLESETEMQRLAALGRELGQRPFAAVRVNPDFELKTSGMKMSGGPKQFGVDAERVPQMLAEFGKLPLQFVGFHIFSGSQNLRADAICEAQRKSVALAIELARHAPGPVQLLNIGGGFGVPYFPGETALDLDPIATNLRELGEQVSAALPQAELVLELGRYLTAEAGIYVCRVIDRKVSRGQVFLITDGGLHQHLAASGNFGQVIRKNYPVLVGNRVRGTKREVVSVVGPLCTPLDLLADRMEMAYADVGDLIVVLQSGAYGLTASPLRFLGHPAPAEVLV
jgi:diaminopimelate decarboxylase